MARFLHINLGDVDDFTFAEIDFLCTERSKEIESEHGFWEHLIAWIVCTIINIVSKRKYKISDLLRKRGEDASARFRAVSAEFNRRDRIENVRR